VVGQAARVWARYNHPDAPRNGCPPRAALLRPFRLDAGPAGVLRESRPGGLDPRGSLRRSVFEFGCGTGRFADRLLSRELPPDARYAGVDLSSTMVDLATRRLARFGERAQVTLTEGDVRFPFPDASFDRVVATYVLDILGEERIRELLLEAHRLPGPSAR
jgi:SAM-dependent methyltransferase